MRAYHPKATQLPALERNILKYRALEMVIILFEVEDLKNFALNAVQGTDKVLRDEGKQCIPEGAKINIRKHGRRLFLMTFLHRAKVRKYSG